MRLSIVLDRLIGKYVLSFFNEDEGIFWKVSTCAGAAVSEKSLLQLYLEYF
jgi:hypothetical protein